MRNRIENFLYTVLGLDRLGNVPWLLFPIVWIYWRTVTLIFYMIHITLYCTARIKIEGTENLRKNQNYVYIGWHDSVIPYIAAFWRFDRPHALMLSDAWFMYPLCKLAKWLGVKALVYGMTGSKGRDAAEQIQEYLIMGFSTLITPDGPRGPRRKLRRGALHIAKNTNVPILPISVTCTGCFTVNSWDIKIIPLPFARITVTYHEPVFITAENIESVTADIEKKLGA